MAGKKVLVVDDDAHIVELVELYLKRDGYKVITARDGIEALRLARENRPDLVVLDLMLPGIDGLDVCRDIREDSNVPIIMLTAKISERDRVVGLGMGADDYVTKPFSPRELAARVRAVLRRTDQAMSDQGPAQITHGDVGIDVPRRQVSVAEKPVSLTSTEFALLRILLSEPGRVFSRAELVDRVFERDFEGFDRTVDVHISNLRRKLEPDPKHPRYITTIYGVGYKFEAAAA